MNPFRFLSLKCIFLMCLVAISVATFGQSVSPHKYSKVKVNLIGRDIKDLDKAGIETDHGIFVKNRYFINDFSTAELDIIRNLGFEWDVLIEDVISYYQDEKRASEIMTNQLQSRGNCDLDIGENYNYKTPDQYTSGSMAGYFTYQEMLDILDDMTTKYPDLMSPRQNIGDTTHNGNHVFYIKVSDQPLEDDINEPKVLYTAVHHAREPNSLSQMIFYLWYLLENYGKDDIVTHIVDNTQMYFVPCVNPDGYILNQQNNPQGGGLWRKNAWKDTDGALKGVDLNRNYGYFWGFDNIGSSINPNSATYRGPDAFSEPETKAVRELCLANEFVLALNYHTFGNLLVHPWGYNDQPTDEDILFKTMGNVLNKENNFLMGTGTETVGYTTNGDSDDWMYGESGEKLKIYSYTPEVGPSFWPPVVDIDYLNRSNMWQNLSLALLTGNYYEAVEDSKDVYLTPSSKNIYIKVSKAGLKDGASTITLTSNTAGVEVIDPIRAVSLPLLGSEDLVFPLNIDEQMSYENGIDMQLQVTTDGLTFTTDINKKWLEKEFNLFYFDDLTDGSLFATDTWTLTTDEFFSPPSSYTDSDGADYIANDYTEIVIKDPVDLSGNISLAALNFRAKWNIEAGYDFVQILVSNDNQDFIPLCGKYTKPGTSDQQLNSPLYDGVQDEWVLEEIDLQDFIGSPTVWFKFALVSDQFEERDGFYFDDFGVKIVESTSNIADVNVAQVSLLPNIVHQTTTCKLQGALLNTGTKAIIKNNMGQYVNSLQVVDNEFIVNPVFLQNGMYYVEIIDSENKITSHKLVILK